MAGVDNRDRSQRVWVVVFCPSTKQYLMARRSKSSNNPGLWNFFGGNADHGEALEKSAQRELFEEAGLKLKPELKFTVKLKVASINFFVARVNRTIVPKLNEENDSWGWFTLSAIKGMKLHRSTRLYFNKRPKKAKG